VPGLANRLALQARGWSEHVLGVKHSPLIVPTPAATPGVGP
jgi:hypothetical protein